MDDYGFGTGIVRRLFRKVLPQFAEDNTVEYFLLKSNNSVAKAMELIDFANVKDSNISKDLDLAIKALGTRIASFGLDNQIKKKYDTLHLDTLPFEGLLDKLSDFSDYTDIQMSSMIESIDAIESLVVLLRKNKRKIGTSFHLTVSTRRILEYIDHLKDLINLKLHIGSKTHWDNLFRKYIEFANGKNSLRRYVAQHSDLVALEIVEHTSSKGGKYIAESKSEYWSFFYRSMLGGGMISFFAIFKIWFDSLQLTQLQNAWLYSINYAICFVIVKQVGGIIATKQPAVTASTIAKGIDGNDDLKINSIQSIIHLIRKVIRSQFISIMGNFVMGLFFACLLAIVFKWAEWNQIIAAIDPEYLIKNTLPTAALVIFSAIAGFFLAISGLISGYVDNKFVASKIGYRIRNSMLFFKSSRIADFMERKAGTLIGNICLGFFLGSVFLLSNFLPFSIDIRHIAFSSANVGYAIMNFDFNFMIILWALVGTLLIGFVNFIVSFSITLLLALKSRGANFKFLPKLFFSLTKDFFRQPLNYFLFISRDDIAE